MNALESSKSRDSRHEGRLRPSLAALIGMWLSLITIVAVGAEMAEAVKKKHSNQQSESRPDPIGVDTPGQSLPQAFNLLAARWRQTSEERPMVNTTKTTPSASLTAGRGEPKIISVKWAPLESPLDDNPEYLGGGRRIFPGADGPGMRAGNRRKVILLIEVAPPLPGVDVFVRSFDVDDSSGVLATGSGNDNLGGMVRWHDPINGRGAFQGFADRQPIALKTNDKGMARGIFIVSMQPGDNFKVAASLDEELIERLVLEGQQIKDPQTGTVLADSIARQENGAEAMTTDLLTVWRRLHIEVDSMNPSPDPGAVSSATHPERRFIRGYVLGMEGSDKKMKKFTLVPDPSRPPVELDDGSPNLSKKGRDRGNGRFEGGTLTIGVGVAAVKVGNLDGNGDNFVVKKAGSSIPFRLIDGNWEHPLPSGPHQSVSIIGLRAEEREFKLSQRVSSGMSYAGGTLTVAGMSFQVVQVVGRRVVVSEEPRIPFLLVEEASVTSPFLEKPPAGEEEQGDTPFKLMENSDNPEKNLYARAYIKPVYDLPGSTVAFNKNVERTEFRYQLFSGQDYESTPDFWVVYLQGAFQGVAFERVERRSGIYEIGDASPQSEALSDRGIKRMAEIGRTDAAIALDGSLLRIGGSNIYLQTVRRMEELLAIPCLGVTIVHETGHQFGLTDGTKGIMEPCSSNMEKRFRNEHLKLIRQRAHPQGL